LVVARVTNPYRPGFNQAPATLAGRGEVLEDLVDALETAAVDELTPRPVLLVGGRGVGKTVLLAEIAARAGAEYGWPRVHAEVRPGARLTGDLTAALDDARRLVEQQPPPRGLPVHSATVKAQIAGLGGELRFERPAAGAEREPFRELHAAMAHLAASVVERGSGFVLTIDEAQLAQRTELGGVAALLQDATGRNLPIVTVIAGLPTMREPQHSVTYFERGIWHELGLLATEDSILALREPAASAGRPMDEDAARLLADASGGYPYAIQLYGHYAWRASAGARRINEHAARQALPRAQRELERGLYTNRWAAAPPSHRRYLAAVAELITNNRPATGRAVADELGRTTKQLSKVRDELLTQGTLTTIGEQLRFTVPGMAAYVSHASTERSDDHSDRGPSPGH
jgi:hypothetical protein